VRAGQARSRRAGTRRVPAGPARTGRRLHVRRLAAQGLSVVADAAGASRGCWRRVPKGRHTCLAAAGRCPPPAGSSRPKTAWRDTGRTTTCRPAIHSATAGPYLAVHRLFSCCQLVLGDGRPSWLRITRTASPAGSSAALSRRPDEPSCRSDTEAAAVAVRLARDWLTRNSSRAIGSIAAGNTIASRSKSTSSLRFPACAIARYRAAAARRPRPAAVLAGWAVADAGCCRGAAPGGREAEGRGGNRYALWVPITPSTSCDQPIFVDQATGASMSSGGKTWYSACAGRGERPEVPAGKINEAPLMCVEQYFRSPVFAGVSRPVADCDASWVRCPGAGLD